VSAYEANIHKLDGELNYNDQTVIIAFDIKYITLIANAIYIIVGFLYICEARPAAFFDSRNPILKGYPRFGMFLGILF
jgi:hypothetical protein